MIRVQIDAAAITDWDTFHDVFAEAFGFPDFYGRNMDAWIDCMTHLDDPESGMSSITYNKKNYAVLEIENVKEFKTRCPEQYEALIKCSAFVNHRWLEMGEVPLVVVAFFG